MDSNDFRSPNDANVWLSLLAAALSSPGTRSISDGEAAAVYAQTIADRCMATFRARLEGLERQMAAPKVQVAAPGPLKLS